MRSPQQFPGRGRGKASLSLRAVPAPRHGGPDALNGLPRLRSIESAKLIEHQMYFWGWDVLHPEGNLLIAAGCRSFHRADCPHAVRCYRLETPAAVVTLHSTGVSLRTAGGSPGVVYLRPTHRLYHVPEDTVPLPYGKGVLRSMRRLRPNEFSPALTALLAFVRAYERWAAHRWHPESRLAAWREQKSSASKGVRWLKPKDSLRWLDACLAAREAAEPNQYTAPEAFEFPAHP